MKVALISDTHYGVRNDKHVMLDYQKKFLDQVFFPTLKKRKITEILHCGDLVDRRKVINIHTHSRMRMDFLEACEAQGFDLTVLAGNHDIYFKNKITTNALTEFVGRYPNVQVVDHPVDNWKGLGILLIPWICEENYETVMTAVRDSDCPAMFGHLELHGFEMDKGRYATHGLDATLFDKFGFVGSGHFHHKSDYQNIHYLGSPWESTWSDFDDPKGFHIFDTNTHELEFIENPFKLMHKVLYDDKDRTFEEVMDVDFEQFRDGYLRVIIKSKENAFWFDSFMTAAENSGAIEVKPVDEHLNLAIAGDDDILDGAETTMDIIRNNIESADLSDDYKTSLHELFHQLHTEATAIQA